METIEDALICIKNAKTHIENANIFLNQKIKEEDALCLNSFEDILSFLIKIDNLLDKGFDLSKDQLIEHLKIRIKNGNVAFRNKRTLYINTYEPKWGDLEDMYMEIKDISTDKQYPFIFNNTKKLVEYLIDTAKTSILKRDGKLSYDPNDPENSFPR